MRRCWECASNQGLQVGPDARRASVDWGRGPGGGVEYIRTMRGMPQG